MEKEKENNDQGDRLKGLEIELAKMSNKLDDLDHFIRNNLAKDCSKMSNHIDFVDNVYETIKSPLNYICSQVNYAIGEKNEPVKSLKSK